MSPVDSSRISPGSPSKLIYFGIFLTAMSTLLLEFTLTRVLSVSLWYHFAFMIISVALLGFGISGVILFRSKSIGKIPTGKLLSILGTIYGFSVIACFILIGKVPFDPFSLMTDSMQFVYLPIYYLLITIPFLFAGLIISVILTRFKSDVSKLYFADLVGAGLACVAFVIVIPALGGSGGIVAAAAIGFLAAILFGYESNKAISLIALIFFLLSFIFLIDAENRLPIKVTANKIYGNYMELRPDLKIRTDWNTFSKVDVLMDEEKAQDGYDTYLAVIDAGNATTTIPNVKVLPLPNKSADASNMAFASKDSVGRVFIIGSAGGGEILSGLYYGAESITAVEINGILNDHISNNLAYWTGPLVKDNKKVKLITDDARTQLTSKRIQYDVIVSAHTISSSAVSSGAMSMVENYILTKEAVADYIRHLEWDGILYISRPETQLPKLITTLKQARYETSKGLENSKKSFVVFRRPPGDFEGEKSFLGGIIYSKRGFSEKEVLDMRREAASLSLEILYDPTLNQPNIYSELIESPVDVSIEKYGAKVEPATDDKPFFDQNIGFGGLTFAGVKETFSQDDKAILALKDKPVAETTMAAILVQSLLAAFVFLILPFIVTKEKYVSDKGTRSFLVYFSLLGIAYIMMQIALIQKFTLLLGQPVYTLLTVVSTMLIFSGLGSWFSKKFFSGKKIRLNIIFLVIAVSILLIGFLNPYLFSALTRTDIWLRVVVSAVVIAVPSFFMGMPFPIGIGMLSDSDKGVTALAWAVNGFFSVIGSVLAIIFAMTGGFRFVFAFAAACYLAAMFFAMKRSGNAVLKPAKA
ncbi:MAG: hypothetical protein IPL67_02410 [Ignavibacteria bacterium]|nr:hypothetical protein [Ignavibacteria bacterium]